MNARAYLLWMWPVNFLIGQLYSAVDCWGSECSRCWVFVCWLSLSTICALPVWALARYGTVNVPSRADTDTAPLSAGHMMHLSLVGFHSHNPSFFLNVFMRASTLKPIIYRNVSMRAMQRSGKERRG
jgi:hypothetical protein